MNELTAAFDPRYEYHPPSALSVVEPTRADIVSHVEWFGNSLISSLPDDVGVDEAVESRFVDRFGRNGRKCFAMSIGPMVLTAKACVNWVCSSWRGDFSGYKMPGMMNARRRCEVEEGKRALHLVDAEEIVDSSITCQVLPV